MKIWIGQTTMKRTKMIRILFVFLVGMLFFVHLTANVYICEANVSPEDSSGFVDLSEFAPDVILEIRYYSDYNFVGRRIAGYEEPCALMTREAALALKAVAEDVKEQGYKLKIYDAYRPQMAVDYFVEWAGDLDDIRMKPYFYPETDKEVLFEEGYIASRSGHSKGSTVDLTLVDIATGKEVDMGSSFDYFGSKSHLDWCGNPDIGEYVGAIGEGEISEEQFNNRMILRNAMVKHGFRPIDTEWWHFTLEEEPYPDIYFNFPVRHLMKQN